MGWKMPVHLIGLVVIALLCSSCSGSTPETTTRSQSGIIASSAGSQSIQLPADESRLLSTVASFKARYQNATNEFQKSSVRRERAAALAQVFPDRTVGE